MSPLTGPAIPTNGNHVHAFPSYTMGLEGALDMSESADWRTFWSPGSYQVQGDFWGPDIPEMTEIGGDLWPDIPEAMEIGQSTFYEIGCRVPVLGYGGPSAWEIGDFYEIGDEEVEAFSRRFDANPPRLTGRVHMIEKNGRICACAEVYIPSEDTCIFVGVKVPLKKVERLIREAARRGPEALQAVTGMDPNLIAGWNPFKKAKNLAKTVGKKYAAKALKKAVYNPAFRKLSKETVAASKYVGKKAKKAAKNPYVRRFAQAGAVVAAQYYGVPPEVTLQATNVLFDAMAGNDVAMDKVANIAMEAAEGSESAQKLKNTMSLLYQGGMREMQPYLDQAKAAEATAQKVLSVQAAAKALPPVPALPGKPPGLFPFNVPGFDYGPPIEGWLFNVPYRGNIAAKELDVLGKGRNPFHLLRGAYSQGMK